ncbi:MAG: substrate binding domain-containing protein, partial [Bdellovibrionales bacterium]|nr:substrate binding domain-containing protein [Bdellovibrionales bacterium]
TSQGKIFYQTISPLINQLNSNLENFTEKRHALSGKIRITLPEDMGVELMGEICYEFLQQHPLIHLDVHPENRLIDLVKEGFDLAIRMGTLKDSTLTQKRLCELKLTTVASPRFFERFPIPKTITDLEGLPFLSFTGFQNKSNQVNFTSSSGSKKIRPKTIFSSNNFFCLRSLCLKGLGYTILPKFLAKNLVERNELIKMLPEWELPGSKAHILYPHQREQPLRVKKFIEFLQKKMVQLV